MIVRITFGDNDLHDELIAIGNTIPYLDLCKIIDVSRSDLTKEDIFENLTTSSRYDKLRNPNNQKNLNEDDIKFLSATYRKFCEHTIDLLVVNDSDKSYMKERLSVEIVPSYSEKWENGEVLYWFSYSNVIIVQ